MINNNTAFNNYTYYICIDNRSKNIYVQKKLQSATVSARDLFLTAEYDGPEDCGAGENQWHECAENDSHPVPVHLAAGRVCSGIRMGAHTGGKPLNEDVILKIR